MTENVTISRDELDEILDIIRAYEMALDNVLYRNYSERGLIEEMDKTERVLDILNRL